MRDFLGFAFMIGGILAWLVAYGDGSVLVAVIGSGLFVGGCALIGPQQRGGK